MVGSLTAGLISGSFYAMGPMVALKIGLPIAQVSWFMSLTVWSGLLFQWPVGLLSDRFDRLTVLSILGFAVLLVSVSISVLGSLSLSLLLLLTTCFGVVFTIYPVAMARAQDNIDKKNIVPVSGALILFFGVGACMGPILSSLIIAQIGPWGLYHFTAICGGILGGTAWIYRNKLPVKVEDQVPFIPIPKTSSVVSALDPRGDPDDYNPTKDAGE
jgi:MFS family permease